MPAFWRDCEWREFLTVFFVFNLNKDQNLLNQNLNRLSKKRDVQSGPLHLFHLGIGRQWITWPQDHLQAWIIVSISFLLFISTINQRSSHSSFDDWIRSVFEPPSGQTCKTWSREFLRTGGGYVDNPSATNACRYCPYAVGDECESSILFGSLLLITCLYWFRTMFHMSLLVFTPLNYSYSNCWRDLGILVAYVVFDCLITIIATKFLTLRYAKRWR